MEAGGDAGKIPGGHSSLIFISLLGKNNFPTGKMFFPSRKKNCRLAERCFISPQGGFVCCISAGWLSKKKKKTFAGFEKKRTFASRLLSQKDKHLIHSELIFHCPGGLANGEESIFSSNI